MIGGERPLNSILLSLEGAFIFILPKRIEHSQRYERYSLVHMHICVCVLNSTMNLFSYTVMSKAFVSANCDLPARTYYNVVLIATKTVGQTCVYY